MRGMIITALGAFLALIVIAGPKPASALPAAAALDYSQPNASGDLVEVKKWYKKKKYYRGRNYRPYRYNRGPYYRPYRYRPYRPYYSPYRRRGGVSIWW